MNECEIVADTYDISSRFGGTVRGERQSLLTRSVSEGLIKDRQSVVSSPSLTLQVSNSLSAVSRNANSPSALNLAHGLSRSRGESQVNVVTFTRLLRYGLSRPWVGAGPGTLHPFYW